MAFTYFFRDAQTLRCGDRMFEVIYTPGHSNDSICLYCQEDGVLFVGDTPVIIRSTDGSYEEVFIQALERLCRKDVKAVYFGHGEPLFDDCNARLRSSLRNVKEGLGRRQDLLQGDRQIPVRPRQQRGFDNPL